MQFYIEFLNKDKNFRQDKVSFDSYEQAQNWGKENLGNFQIDMIKFDFL